MYKTVNAILLAIQIVILMLLSAVLINANMKADAMDDTIGFFNMICFGGLLFYVMLSIKSWNNIQKSIYRTTKEPSPIIYNIVITLLPLLGILVIVLL